MAINDPSDPEGALPINRIFFKPSGEALVPKTSIDHLLTAEEVQQAAAERAAFETLAAELGRQDDFRALYPVYYNVAQANLNSGMSHHGLRTEMEELMIYCDPASASILREAYEDVLAGRPPKDVRDGQGRRDSPD